ncbi:MAG: phosphoesterase [Pseudonocardiales bacterium]|nr:phosphoesterase [Pseudonocardiales bacterium]
MSIAERSTDEKTPENEVENPVAPRRYFGVDARYLRWTAVSVWLVALAVYIANEGIPIDRFGLMAWLLTGLLASCVGRRPLWTVFVDWLPFTGVLVAYDLTRGLADALGRPTMWTPQIALERDLFGGNVPTIWLQAHIKYAQAPWWEVAVSTTYVSYFILPYLAAGLLWIRNRGLWRKFAIQFLLINLIGLATFIVLPAAPPWAASRCTAAEIADHPSDPPCLLLENRLADNGLLGQIHNTHPGASHYVERLGTRGFEKNGLKIAATVVNEGQADVNEVAAIPSLHAALSMFLVVFLWPLTRRRWRVLLPIYPLVMAFSLVYSAEHYVVDILSGWTVTAIVCVGTRLVERKLAAKRLRSAADSADTLEVPAPA